MRKLWATGLLFLFACQSSPTIVEPVTEESTRASDVDVQPEATSLLGEPLFSRKPSLEHGLKLVEDLARAEVALAENPDDEMAWVWLGRRLAYLGRYQEAIAFYGKGIERFPESYRLLRHRGHRYLTVRDFDAAIADLTKAAQLAEGHENQLEPDGAPNPSGIPISSTHGNIHYHLGLAHYWKNELEAAYLAFQTAASFAMNEDAICSSHWWKYVLERSLGKTSASQFTLERITPEMKLVENFAYHRLLLAFKGVIAFDDLEATEAERYGLSLSYHWLGGTIEAVDLWTELVESDDHRWEAFGTIGAEVMLARARSQRR